MPSLFDMLPDGAEKESLAALGKKAVKPTATPRTPLQRESHDGPRRAFKVIPDFVAVDLETTGLSDRDDRITEIAAVRFVDGKAVAEYSTFVNPLKAIPKKITELTSITDAMVANAPLFRDVAAELIAFMGDLPLCGHQVDFDADFLNAELKRAGMTGIKNPQLDTAALSRMLLDGLPGYSLGAVAAHLGVPLVNAHRALDDARASGEVAALLVPKIEAIPGSVRRRMGQFAPYSFIKVLLIRGLPEEPVATPKVLPPLSIGPLRQGMPTDPEALKAADVDALFDADGALSKQLAGYAPRDSQVSMARSVASAISGGGVLIAEAGTGTGKSLAYLLPAAQWAVRNSARIFISTATRNLQDQLTGKDLPVVKNIVPDLRFCALKGRSNYLCRERWQRFLSGEFGGLGARERLGVLPLIRWAEQTITGDIEELGQFNRTWFARIWGLVAAESHGCRGRACRHFEGCYLQRARIAAYGSHIVVINHALFFAEVCAESSFLGTPAAIIFDEAHQIEQTGYRSLRTEVDSNRLSRLAEMVAGLEKEIEKSTVIDDGESRTADFRKLLKRLRRNSEHFQQEAMAWATAQKAKAAPSVAEEDVDFCFRYDDKPLASSGGRAGLFVVLGELQEFIRDIRMMYDAAEKTSEHLYVDSGAVADRMGQLKADLDYLCDAKTEEHVFWAEGSLRKGWFKLSGVPLDIGGMLSAIWARQEGGLVFTSATIRAGESDSYFRTRMGLLPQSGRLTFKSFASPFLAEQSLRVVLDAGPLPDDPDFTGSVADTVAGILDKTGRNILVLFTANTMLNAVHDALKTHAGLPSDATVLSQNVSGNRNTVLAKFKNGRKTVLLGVQSFWEGVDAPGQACEIVVIPRLPFPVPTHPLAAALSERAEKEERGGFFGYSVPEAVIRFRQGAGRLIRTVDDQGVLVVLDQRLVTKGYGKQFSGAVGPFVAEHDVSGVVAAVERFFG